MSLRAVIAAAVAIALLAAAPAPAAAEAAALELVRSERLDDRLLELTFRTPALSGTTDVRVLLPDGYDSETSRRYPVLYLLHGCCEGDAGYRAWTDKGDAARITAGEPLLVVMPESGNGGGYTDWHNDGAGGPPMWETYHVGQLLPWIDGHLRTVAHRDGRAVAGLSMGGYGAMHYAARHPDLFAAAASFSGAVDSNSIFVQPFTGSEGWQQGRPGAVFGHRATEEVRWRGHNPWDLAENLDGLHLTLRTANGMPGGPGGDTGDPVEAEVHTESVSLHRRLVELGIPHIWDDYGAGGHTWYYWKRDLELLMPDLAEVFAAPPSPPSSFTHRSIERAYEAHGWRVEIDRPALEFSELRGADRDGFALRGSGTAAVTSAPLYAPGSELSVHVRRGDGAELERVAVSEDCRLRLSVPLGPGNPYQQYTAQARAHGIQEQLGTLGTAPSSDTSGTRVYTTRVGIDAAGVPGCPGGAR